jgi:hypothetical protein
VSRRTVLIAGERHALDMETSAERDTSTDWIEVAPVPLVERRLRVPGLDVPLLAPFGHRPRSGFRELTSADPRLSRLWGRFSVDVGVATERDPKLFAERVFADGRHRMFIVEDGDRYAIRGMCAFTVVEEDDRKVGHVVELLHDRSVQGLFGASHVLGLALRAMSDAGADLARAWSFTHSGSFPIFARHAFLPRKTARVIRVKPEDPTLTDFIAERRHWYVSSLDDS